METSIAFAITTIATMLYSIWIISRQNRTIDKLTDKLMAKDYSEYKRHREPFQDTKDAPRARKPMSFHDDPNIEIEEETEMR